MKRLFSRLLPALCSGLIFAAAVSVKPACAWWFYQPAVPKALREE
ncbi:MAG: cyclic lactone autoinducer peptide [Clostridia bacterium]|nr:cyclic lactone autoinducer peptide [Clostridia bacterium]